MVSYSNFLFTILQRLIILNFTTAPVMKNSYIYIYIYIYIRILCQGLYSYEFISWQKSNSAYLLTTHTVIE